MILSSTQPPSVARVLTCHEANNVVTIEITAMEVFWWSTNHDSTCLQCVHQLRMMLFVPPELALMLQASANGNDDSGQEVSVSLHAEHEVKGHLQTNGGDCQRFQIVRCSATGRKY